MLKGRTERIFFKAALWLIILFLLFITVFLAGTTWELRQKERTAWKEEQYAKSQYEEVSLRHESLIQKIANLSTDRGLEEEYRKRFPVARAGEEVIVLVDAPETASDTKPQAPRTFWQRLESWLHI